MQVSGSRTARNPQLCARSGSGLPKNPDEWYQEQGKIAQRFQGNPAAQIGAEPAPTPSQPSAAPSNPPDQANSAPNQAGLQHLGGYNAEVNV